MIDFFMNSSGPSNEEIILIEDAAAAVVAATASALSAAVSVAVRTSTNTTPLPSPSAARARLMMPSMNLHHHQFNVQPIISADGSSNEIMPMLLCAGEELSVSNSDNDEMMPSIQIETITSYSETKRSKFSVQPPVWRKIYDFTEEVDGETEDEIEESENEQANKSNVITKPRKHDISVANNTCIPAPRSGHSCVLIEEETFSNSKSKSHKMLVFGGFAPKPINNALNDLWEFDLDRMEWTKIHDCDNVLEKSDPVKDRLRTTPQARVGHSGTFTKNSNKFINFSGRNDVAGDFRDVWEFDAENLKWKQLECKGEIPPEFILHSAVCHGDKMIIFGGWSWGIFNSLYQLDLKTLKWKKIECKGQSNIKPRERHSAVIFENKMIVFGGHINEEFLNDVAELNLDTMTWSKKNCLGDLPEGLRSHTAVVDNVRRKMLVFGGKNSAECTNNLYELDLDTYKWTKWPIKGDIPEQRGRHTCVMSENKGKMIIFSGTNGRIYFNDLYICDFGHYQKDISNLFEP